MIFKRDIKRSCLEPRRPGGYPRRVRYSLLYAAWYNIVANWDPYGNTQGIKIAIAINDRGTQNDLGVSSTLATKWSSARGESSVAGRSSTRRPMPRRASRARRVLCRYRDSQELLEQPGFDARRQLPSAQAHVLRQQQKKSAIAPRLPIPVQTPSRSRSTRNLSLR